MEQTLRLIGKVSVPFVAGWCLETLAWIAIREDKPTRAAVLMGAAGRTSRRRSGAFQ